MNDQAKNLQRLFTMIRDVELMRLSALATRTDAANAGLTELQDDCGRRADVVSRLTQPDAAMTSGSDRNWQIWAEREANRLTGIAADAVARQQDQRDVARKAAGRLQAFEKMQTRLRKPRQE